MSNTTPHPQFTISSSDGRKLGRFVRPWGTDYEFVRNPGTHLIVLDDKELADNLAEHVGGKVEVTS